MNRREFIVKSTAAGILTGFAVSSSGMYNFFGEKALLPNEAFDLVAVKGGEPDAMFDKAIESLGGIGKFVKKNQTVVVKPNIGWDVAPENAGNTNPSLVGRIVKLCYNAGAKKVYVFDNTCDKWNNCYKNSGIELAVKNAGGEMVPANTESHYQEVAIPKGKKLKTAKVHELILSSDVVINVPIIKNHMSADLTICMKNLMGIVWDRRYWHRNNLHQCIADFATYHKPTLNVVDAYRILTQNGPRGVSVDDTKLMKSLIVSTDMVAADAASAKLFGTEPDKIDYIKIASEMNIGQMNLDKLNINRIKL